MVGSSAVKIFINTMLGIINGSPKVPDGGNASPAPEQSICDAAFKVGSFLPGTPFQLGTTSGNNILCNFPELVSKSAFPCGNIVCS